MSSDMKKTVLLDNASATGPAVLVVFGGRQVFSIVGTFNGGTAQLQMLGPDGFTFIDIANGAFTAPGAVAVDVPFNKSWKVTLTGSPSKMFAELASVPQ